MTKNREQFVKQIEMEESMTIEILIKKYFDETMLLYDLVGTYESTSVTSTVRETRAHFVLSFQRESECDTFIRNSRVHREFGVYGRTLTCDMEQISNSVHISIYQGGS